MFDIKDLCDRVNISRATFYRLIRDNESFRELTESHKEKSGKAFKYGAEVLEWLISYYDNNADNTDEAVESAESVDAETVQSELQSLRDENKVLRAQIEDLKRELSEKESERKQLFDNTQNLLLLLTQEKAEKQRLLPAPKRSLFQRIFGRGKTGGES